MGWRGQIRWARAARLAGIAIGVLASAATLGALLGDPQAPPLPADIGLLPPTGASPVLASRVQADPAGHRPARETTEDLARAVGSGLARETRRLRRKAEPSDRPRTPEPRDDMSRSAGVRPPPLPAPPDPVPAPSPPPPAPAAPSPATNPPAGAAGPEFGFEH